MTSHLRSGHVFPTRCHPHRWQRPAPQPDRVFVDVYEHDSNLEELNDLDSELRAHIVIDGWDKLIRSPQSKEPFSLKTDSDDRTDIAENHPEKVETLSKILDDWLRGTPCLH